MLKTKKEYNDALVHLEALWPTKDQPTNIEFQRLLDDVHQYEVQHFPEPLPPTIMVAVLFRAEQEGRINPCPSCGRVADLDYTDVVHRDTGIVWYQLWCQCGCSSNLYYASAMEALTDWNSLWETKA
jgi:hypothetical protein